MWRKRGDCKLEKILNYGRIDIFLVKKPCEERQRGIAP
jgi:hypothetical protein